MLAREDFEKLVDRLASRCGQDLIVFAEEMRSQAHVDGEDAQDDEGRVRAQAVAVVYREMAKTFRNEHAKEVANVIQADRTVFEGANK